MFRDYSEADDFLPVFIKYLELDSAIEENGRESDIYLIRTKRSSPFPGVRVEDRFKDLIYLVTTNYVVYKFRWATVTSSFPDEESVSKTIKHKQHSWSEYETHQIQVYNIGDQIRLLGKKYEK